MVRATLRLVVLVALGALVVSGCAEREVNPFDPSQDQDPPVVSSFRYTDGVAEWTTDEAALCVLEYGDTGGEYDHYVYESTKDFDTEHRVDFLRMTEGEAYRIRIRSVDRAGNEAYETAASLPESVVGRAYGGTTMTLSMIDVGWGLSMVLTTPDGSNVLIDAGHSDHLQDVITFLSDHGISWFDAMVATHYHGDHVGGYDEDGGIIDLYWTPFFISPDTTSLYLSMWGSIEDKINERDIEVAYVRRGDSPSDTPALVWDDTPGFSVEVLSAGLGGQIGGEEDSSEEGMKGNNDSVVLRITFHDVTYITTGDAEFYTEYSIIDAYGREGVRADLLQVGHHGNNDATSELWLDNVSPRVALISNSMAEAALEKEVVLQGLRAVDADYFVTDRVFPNTPRDADPQYGSIIAVTDGQTIEVVLERHDWDR